MYDSLKCIIQEFMMFIHKGDRFKYAKLAIGAVCSDYGYGDMELQEDGDTLKVLYDIKDDNTNNESILTVIRIMKGLNGIYKYSSYEFVCSILKLDDYANYVEDTQFNYKLSIEDVKKINWELIDKERLMKLL